MANTKSVKQSTDEKNVEKESRDSMHKKILVLTHDQEQLLHRRNKRDAITNSIIMGFYLVIVILGAIYGAGLAVLNSAAMALWLGLVWFLERRINQQRYIINMQSGLHDLEREELDTLMESLKQPPQYHSKSEERRVKAMKGEK